MKPYSFEARIDGRNIICRITPAGDAADPVFCFSLMSPPAVVSGGELIRSVGGYGEVRLPDLKAGEVCEFVLAYASPDLSPVNRAWLPLGAYLRIGESIVELPRLQAGVKGRQGKPARPDEGLRLVPPPVSWSPSGDPVLRAGAFACGSPLLAAAEGLAGRCGLPQLLASTGTPLELWHDPSLPAEGYRLSIATGGVRLDHADAAGAHYGAVSLLVLRCTHHGAIPCGIIEDAPRFEWRGQHLDCARHFYRPETLTRLLDLMALLKLNRFHWHFSDDEAFRLEVACFPQIWRQTGFRGEGELVPGVFGGGPRAGGSYSKQVAAELVAHARALHIEVLPEIEVPAHAFGLAAAMPELRDPLDSGTETSVQGYGGNVINPAMPRTWDVLEALALEVSGLFPFGHLHLGCDEPPEGIWHGSPAVDALKQREGLTSSDDVQEWTMRRLADHLTRHGIRPAAWEEAARGHKGGIGHDAILFSWSGQGPGVEAARVGYDIVMCPAQHVYLDMAHSSAADDWGAAWAAFVALEDTIAWSVVPDPDIADRVKGVEGTFWSEFTTEDREIEPMIAPRILGVATMAWSAEGKIGADSLHSLAWACAPLFDAMGWAWNRP